MFTKARNTNDLKRSLDSPKKKEVQTQTSGLTIGRCIKPVEQVNTAELLNSTASLLAQGTIFSVCTRPNHLHIVPMLKSDAVQLMTPSF